MGHEQQKAVIEAHLGQGVKTHVNTAGVLCVEVEHLRPVELADKTIEWRHFGEVIGMPVHHLTDAEEQAGGTPLPPDAPAYLERRPIDKRAYGKPIKA